MNSALFAVRLTTARVEPVFRRLMAVALLSACSLAAASYAVAGENPKTAANSLLRLSDLPEDWAGPTTTKADKNKCNDLVALLKPDSTSVSRARFENGSDSLVNVVAQFKTTTLADATNARIAKWSKDCASRSYKVDGQKVTATMSEFNFTPPNTGIKFKAFREATEANGFKVDARLVFYRKGLAAGVVAIAGFSVDTELLKDAFQIATSRV